MIQTACVRTISAVRNLMVRRSAAGSGIVDEPGWTSRILEFWGIVVSWLTLPPGDRKVSALLETTPAEDSATRVATCHVTDQVMMELVTASPAGGLTGHVTGGGSTRGRKRVRRQSSGHETLETRIVLDTSIRFFDGGRLVAPPIDNYRGSVSLPELRENDRVTVEIRNFRAAEAPGQARMTVMLATAGGTQDLSTAWTQGTSDRENVSTTFKVPATGGASLSFSISRLPGTPLHYYGDIIYRIERTSNIRVIGPAVQPNGDVTYGYAIEGDAPLRIKNGSYVEVELFYAKGPNRGDILGSPIHHHNFDQRSGTFTVKAADLKAYPPPEGTTRLLAIVDRNNQIEESNESTADNVKSIVLPNLVALAPVLNTDGTARIAYRLNSAPSNASAPVTVEAWFSTSERWEDRVGKALLVASVDLTKVGGPYGYTISQDALARKPEGATHLVTWVDRNNSVREADESDNTASLALPDVRIVSVKWDGEGGATIRVRIDNAASLPASAVPGLSMFWAIGPDADDVPPDADNDLPRVRLTRTDDPQTIRIDASRLPTLNPNQVRRVGTTITHLVVVADIGLSLPEATEANNVKAIKLPVVSYELSDAPAAATAEERVKLWLQKHQRTIVSEAKARNINPQAIAAAIAWEALNNVRRVEDFKTGIDPRTYGPGKIHYKYIFQNLTGDPVPLVVNELESLGLLPTREDEDRGQFVRTPKGAIKYIAALMGAYADVFDQYGFEGVRNKPAILATLYQGSKYPNLKALFDADPAGMVAPKPAEGDPGKVMGAWVSQNREFLGEAVPTDWIPVLGKFQYVPKRIDVSVSPNVQLGKDVSWAISDLLGVGASELVGFYYVSGAPSAPDGTLQILDGRLIYKAPSGQPPIGTIYYSVRVGTSVLFGGRISMHRDIPPIT